MSLQPPNIQDYIERIAQVYENNTDLFPLETTGENLVNSVIRNKPAIEQSADNGLIPYILVFESSQPIRFLEKAGRDGRNIEGGSVYEVEIYSVIITDAELSAEISQRDIHNITQIMRTALSNNLRLADPTDLTINPLCRTHTKYQIPYVLNGDVPASMKAMNVVVRAQVYVSPRG